MTISSGDKRPFEFREGERTALPEHLAALRFPLLRMVIAIDGPAGSGKSTTARSVATRLGSRYLDTGAMYRALTLAAQRAGVTTTDAPALQQLARTAGIRVEGGHLGTRVFLHDEDVSQAIRDPGVTAAVSSVSAHPEVRQEMVARQRELSRHGGTVMDGRDIGTVVFPSADLKVFLTAAVETRACRRQKEEAERGIERPLDEIEREIQQRDQSDSRRATAPLRCAEDAHVIDTSSMSIEEQVDAVLALAVRVVEARTHSEPASCMDPARPFDAHDWVQPGYRAFRSLHYRLAHAIIHSSLRLFLGARRQLHPAVRVPGSVLVACNHISGLDPPLVGSFLPFEVSFVAKRELFENPLLGRLIRAFNAFPIRRGTADFEALDHAVELLRSGRDVIMFPEGTRQVPGRLGSPRWGFGYVASRAQRPIVPAFVRGSRDLRPRGLRSEPLEIWIGEPFDARHLCGGDEKVSYEAIALLAMQRISGLMWRSAARTPLPGLELQEATPEGWLSRPEAPSRP